MTDKFEAAEATLSKTLDEKIVKVRRATKVQDLVRTFTLQRQFQAFGIHELVEGLEEAVNQNRLRITYSIDSWNKIDKFAIVYGKMTIKCLDTGEEDVTYAVGEGMDGGDKGFGKATSYFRKNALIMAFNLRVGVDNEDYDDSGTYRGGQGPGGADTYHSPSPPQQGHQTAPPRQQNSGGAYGNGPGHNSGSAPGATKTYAISFDPGAPPATMAAADIPGAVEGWLATLRPDDLSSIEVFIANNKHELDRFADDDQQGLYLPAVEALIMGARKRAGG